MSDDEISYGMYVSLEDCLTCAAECPYQAGKLLTEGSPTLFLPKDECEHYELDSDLIPEETSGDGGPKIFKMHYNPLDDL